MNPASRKTARNATRADCDGLWDWNLVSNRIHFSPGWLALAGVQNHEIGNAPDDWFRRVHPEDRDQLLRDIDAARAAGTCEFEFQYRLRHKDGSYRWMSSHGLVVRDDGGHALRLTGTQSDVTAQTVTDAVSGLPNRLLLVERLTQSIERAQRHPSFQYAVLLVHLGRPAGPARHRPGTAGDRLLTAAARRLETTLRSPELMADVAQHHLVARAEGDLFAVLLDGLTDLGRTKRVAERILGEMLKPLPLGGGEVRLTPAIGIALSATGYAHAEDALRDADTALHRARVLGGSHCEVFDVDVLASQESELELEADLEPALDRGEFRLVYQPIVSIAAKQVVGFEALVRWQHPERGLIPPIDFIGMAERSGQIVPLGRWILREACAQLKAWQGSVAGAAQLWVSVNLSAAQLRQPDLVEEIALIVREAELDPRSLTLELTEATAMDNPTAVATVLMRLRALGIRISLDDFGTGYSSLAYLRQFPVDSLKIDQSFVRGIEGDTDAEAIVASMAGMARQLGLHVVAEGVENGAQLERLGSMSCDSAQGYLFAKPLDPSSVPAFLQTPLSWTTDAPAAGGSSAAAYSGRPRRGAGPRFSIRRAVLVAAAVTGVLVSAGVLALMHERQPAASIQPPLEKPGMPPRPSGERQGGAGTLVAAAAGAPAKSATTAAAPAQAAPVTAAKVVSAGVPGRRSFEVVHLHRLGSCRGRLRVTGTALVFTPDEEKESDDAVTLQRAEFSHQLSGHTLTIRTPQRTFRFVPASEVARDAAAAELEKVVGALARQPSS